MDCLYLLKRKMLCVSTDYHLIRAAVSFSVKHVGTMDHQKTIFERSKYYVN